MVAEKPAPDSQSAESAIAFAKKLLETRKADRPTFAQVDERGFTIVGDKTKLVGKPFTLIFTEYRAAESNELIETVHLFAVLDSGTAVHFSDAGGIYRQMSDYTGDFPVHVPNGLRSSTYDTRVQGERQRATTFYLDYDV